MFSLPIACYRNEFQFHRYAHKTEKMIMLQQLRTSCWVIIFVCYRLYS